MYDVRICLFVDTNGYIAPHGFSELSCFAFIFQVLVQNSTTPIHLKYILYDTHLSKTIICVFDCFGPPSRGGQDNKVSRIK